MRDFESGGVPSTGCAEPTMKAVADEADHMMGLVEEELGVLADRESTVRRELEVIETLRDGAHARLTAMRERRATTKAVHADVVGA